MASSMMAVTFKGLDGVCEVRQPSYVSLKSKECKTPSPSMQFPTTEDCERSRNKSLVDGFCTRDEGLKDDLIVMLSDVPKETRFSELGIEEIDEDNLKTIYSDDCLFRESEGPLTTLGDAGFRYFSAFFNAMKVD